MANNKFILFTFGICGLLAICLSANLSVNIIDDIEITYDGKKLQCGNLTCPEKSVRCIVTKKTIGNNTKNLERHSVCFDEKNQVVAQDKKTELNPHPNMTVDIYAENGVNGSLSAESKEQLKKIAEETRRRIAEIENHFNSNGFFDRILKWFRNDW